MRTNLLPTAKRLGLAAALLMATTLGACFDSNDAGGDGGTVTLPPPQGAPKLEDQFGIGFGTIFRVSNTTEPGEPKPGDLIPICFTCEPVNIP
jgi:hypothetical protein